MSQDEPQELTADEQIKMIHAQEDRKFLRTDRSPEIAMTMSPELALELSLQLRSLRDVANAAENGKPLDRGMVRLALSIASAMLSNCRFDGFFEGETTALSDLAFILSVHASDLAALDKGDIVPSLVALPRKGRPPDPAWHAFRDDCCDAVSCFELCGDSREVACAKVAKLGTEKASQLSKERNSYTFDVGMVTRWFKESVRPNSVRWPETPMVYVDIARLQMQAGVSSDIALAEMKANLVTAAENLMRADGAYQWPHRFDIGFAELQIRTGVPIDVALGNMKALMASYR